MALPLKDEVKEKWLGRNAARLLELGPKKKR
jgi:predicted TIM-barrel fold metal-dependent hydrolase